MFDSAASAADNSNENFAIVRNTTPQNQHPRLDDDSGVDGVDVNRLKRLAVDVKTSGGQLTSYTDTELKLQATAEVLNKKCTKANKSLLDNFFTTILENCENDDIKALCVKTSYDNGLHYYYKFFETMRGEKLEWKRALIDRMLTMHIMKRRNKRTGQPLESSSVAQHTKALFAKFRKRGVDWDRDRDFNGQGGFHSVTVETWKKEKQSNPSFSVTAVDAPLMLKSLNLDLDLLPSRVRLHKGKQSALVSSSSIRIFTRRSRQRLPPL